MTNDISGDYIKHILTWINTIDGENHSITPGTSQSSPFILLIHVTGSLCLILYLRKKMHIIGRRLRSFITNWSVYKWNLVHSLLLKSRSTALNSSFTYRSNMFLQKKKKMEIIKRNREHDKGSIIESEILKVLNTGFNEWLPDWSNVSHRSWDPVWITSLRKSYLQTWFQVNSQQCNSREMSSTSVSHFITSIPACHITYTSI